MRIAYSLLVLPLLAGCVNPGIVQISPNTYVLARDDHAGIFGNRHRLAAGVIQDVNTFAAEQGKVAIPISKETKPVGWAGNWASFKYTFRLVDKDDPEVHRKRTFATTTTNNNTVIEQVVELDLHAELTKLDDLRKRGLLSDAEFEAEKKKLLNRDR